jgi:hypothetical protein
MDQRGVAIGSIAAAVVVCACGSSESGGAGESSDGGVDGSGTGLHDGAAIADVSTGVADASSGDTAVDAALDATIAVDASGADGALADGPVVDAATDAPGSCLTSSTQLAIVQNAGGTCSFPYNGPQPSGTMNLLLTPGWGTVCFAGGSQGCGTGSGADGWWLSGPQEISVCDATCTRFYNQTIAGKFTVQLGCPTQTCMH